MTTVVANNEFIAADRLVLNTTLSGIRFSDESKLTVSTCGTMVFGGSGLKINATLNALLSRELKSKIIDVFKEFGTSIRYSKPDKENKEATEAYNQIYGVVENLAKSVMFVFTNNGLVRVQTANRFISFSVSEDPIPLAVGSGGAFITAALAMGNTLKDAFEIVSELDSCTGAKFDRYTRKDLKPLPSVN